MGAAGHRDPLIKKLDESVINYIETSYSFVILFDTFDSNRNGITKSIVYFRVDHNDVTHFLSTYFGYVKYILCICTMIT